MQHRELKKLDVYYPKKMPFNHCYEFASIFKETPKESLHFKRKYINKPDEIKAEISELKSYWGKLFRYAKQSTFIISAESLTGYKPSEIERMKTFLVDFFDEIKVIVYVRSPKTSIKSNWEQKIKMLST